MLRHAAIAASLRTKGSGHDLDSSQKNFQPKSDRTSPKPRQADANVGKNGFDQIVFEFDRDVVISQLEALRLVIAGGVLELGMVAAERVFEPALSRQLERKARSLYWLGQQLEQLQELVAASTGYRPDCEQIRMQGRRWKRSTASATRLVQVSTQH